MTCINWDVQCAMQRKKKSKVKRSVFICNRLNKEKFQTERNDKEAGMFLSLMFNVALFRSLSLSLYIYIYNLVVIGYVDLKILMVILIGYSIVKIM